MTHTLRGPANADAFRVREGRTRRYLDHLAPDELRPVEMTRSVPAMSTIKNAEGKSGLIPWTAANVARSAVDDHAIWSQMDPADAVEWLRAAGDRARDRAAGRGTNVHAYIERLLDGRGVSAWDDADAGSEYRQAIESFVSEWQPDLRYAEVVAFGNVDGDEYAGTLDAIVELPGLGLRLIDYKSRSATANNPHTVYSGEVAQMGGYGSADYLIVEEAGVARRIPMPTLDGCALITFTPDAYEVHPVDLELAADTFRALHGWWRGEQTARKAVGRKARPGGPTIDDLTKAELLDKAAEADVNVRRNWTKMQIVAALTAPTTAKVDDTTDTTVALDTDPTPAAGIERPAVDDISADVDDIRDQLRRRASALMALNRGEEALRRRWPAAVPGISDADYDGLVLITAALNRAEADVGAPFDPPPPPPPPTSTTAPASPPATLDEGPPVSAELVNTVRVAFRVAEPDGAKWCNNLATRAGNLSLDQRPSLRRERIGHAITLLAIAGWHDDELLAAVLDAAEVSTGYVTDPAPIIAVLSAGQASRLAELAEDLTAVPPRRTFTVDPVDGRMRLNAA